MRQALKVRALRRSPFVFGGCFHDLAHLDGEFHRRFVEPLIEGADRMQGAMEFLRRMKFSRLEEFRCLHPQEVAGHIARLPT